MKPLTTILFLFSTHLISAQNFHFKDFEALFTMQPTQVESYFKKKKYKNESEEIENSFFTSKLTFVSKPYKEEKRPKHIFEFFFTSNPEIKRFIFTTRDKKVFDVTLNQAISSGYTLLQEKNTKLEYDQIEVIKHFRKDTFYLVVIERYLKQSFQQDKGSKPFNQYTIMMFKTNDPNPPIKMVKDNDNP